MTKRAIRSYHSAFTGEMVLHSLGKDWRLWRPLPARQVFWTAAIELITVAVLRAVQAHLPVLSYPWGVAYFGVPFSLGWLCSVSRIEGRRLHVAIGAWVRHGVQGRNTVGGHRRSTSLASLRSAQISILPHEMAPRRSLALPLAAAATSILVAVALLAGILGAFSAPHGTTKAATISPRPGPLRVPAIPARPRPSSPQKSPAGKTTPARPPILPIPHLESQPHSGAHPHAALRPHGRHIHPRARRAHASRK